MSERIAPDWRIEPPHNGRVKVRNRDGYLADVAVDTNPETSARNEAAAYLIAASPDLLDAAKHAAMEWRLHGQLTDSCRVLEAAIAKATPPEAP